MSLKLKVVLIVPSFGDRKWEENNKLFYSFFTFVNLYYPKQFQLNGYTKINGFNKREITVVRFCAILLLLHGKFYLFVPKINTCFDGIRNEQRKGAVNSNK